ncbi:MAG TPA: outer membrane lipoprotein-sorting protein [Blastocatellia bacterium]|jgi:hypothetical protein
MLNRLPVGMIILTIALSSCKTAEEAPPAATPPPVDGNKVVADYRALDKARDSTMKIRANISDTSNGSGSEYVVEMNMYRKRSSDGGQTLFIEFTRPAEERDRDVIIKVGPGGEVEATRYVQSNDSFVSTGGVMTEDSLFGMTIQEIVDGQPEKYDFKTTREELHDLEPVYRIEGTLKPGAQSKFPRVVLLVSKENSIVRLAEFYDSQNELARRLTVDIVEQVGGHWTRKQWRIDNFSRKKRIDFVTLEAKYDQQLNDSLFSQERLKKLATK